MNDLLEDLITECDYIVKVNLLSDEIGFGVAVDFAGQKHAEYRVVIDEEGNIYGIDYSSSVIESEDGVAVEEFVPLVKSVIRLYILLDIYRQCRYLKIASEVVRFYNKDGDKVRFLDMFELSLDESENEDEKILEEAINEFLNNEGNLIAISNLMEKNNLIQTFNLLRGLVL